MRCLQKVRRSLIASAVILAPTYTVGVMGALKDEQLDALDSVGVAHRDAAPAPRSTRRRRLPALEAIMDKIGVQTATTATSTRRRRLGALDLEALRSLLEHGDVEAVGCILEANEEEVNEQDPKGNTLLHRVIFQGDGLSDERDVVQVVELLLTNEWNPTLQNKAGETALHDAVRQSYPVVVEQLIRASTRFRVLPSEFVNQRADGEDTALHRAVLSGSPEIVKYLLESGANSMLQGAEGKRPLQLVDDRIIYLTSLIKDNQVRPEPEARVKDYKDELEKLNAISLLLLHGL